MLGTSLTLAHNIQHDLQVKQWLLEPTIIKVYKSLVSIRHLGLHLILIVLSIPRSFFYCGTLGDTARQNAQREPRPPSQVYAFVSRKLLTMPAPDRTK